MLHTDRGCGIVFQDESALSFQTVVPYLRNPAPIGIFQAFYDREPLHSPPP